MRYIHLHPDWPHFSWDEAKLTPLLGDVRHRQGRLLGRMETLGFRFQSEAALDSRTAEVTKSSAIEGVVFDPASVRSSIARRMGMPDSDRLPPNREIEGAVDMMLDATEQYAEPLTVDRLQGWQASLFPAGRRGLQRVLTAQWRTPDMDPMQVISGPISRDRIRRKNIHFEAPSADRLPTEVARFLEWFEHRGEIDPVLQAGVAHLWFVTIHPFEDGNGRVSRAIADLALARADGSSLRFYSMSAQIEAEKKQYYRALEKAQKATLDISDWLLWFLGCLDRTLRSAEASLARIVHKATLWHSVNHSAKLNDRHREVINALLDGPQSDLSTSRYAKIAHCSLDTALRDIRHLVDADILTLGPGGGRSTRYHLRSIKDE